MTEPEVVELDRLDEPELESEPEVIELDMLDELELWVEPVVAKVDELGDDIVAVDGDVADAVLLLVLTAGDEEE